MKSRVMYAMLCVLTLVLVVGTVGAADRLVIPDDMDLPFYLRGLGHSRRLLKTTWRQWKGERRSTSCERCPL